MSSLNISNFIWGIADDVLRDVYVRGKYRDVILPMTVIRRLDAVLEPTKDAVLSMKENLDAAGIANQDAPLRRASGEAFYNVSPFRLRDLTSRTNRQQLRLDFEAYLDGFSPNVQEVLEKFKFRNQIPTLNDADALGYLIEKFLDRSINLSPRPVLNADESVRLDGLDNHSMGTIFEELIRRFNEENNEEAGEHFTPRDVVQLMAHLIFEPAANRIESTTYLVYDGACGTGGMLTVAEDTLTRLATESGKDVSVHLYGQDVNPETYAISKADLILKGEGQEADNIAFGSTLSGDAFPRRQFDFMLSNPPYGKSWKTDLDRMGGKKEMLDPRFIIDHGGDPEYSLVTRSSDGQMLFLANMLSKMKSGTRLGQPHRRGPQRQLPLHRRRRPGREQHPPLDHRERLARGHRRPPPQHVLQHRHRHVHLGPQQPQGGATPGQSPAHRRHHWYRPLRKNLGNKNCELSPDDVRRICDAFLDFEETGQSKIFPNEAFGYRKVTVERPLRLEGIDPERSYKAREIKELRETCERSENAPPVIRKVHRNAEPDPLRGLFPATVKGRPAVVEYEPDSDLRDTEQVPLLEEGGVEAFLRREVLPYATDAWYVPSSVKIGYEISFTRHFYKPQPLRPLEDIRADILALERETEDCWMDCWRRSRIG